MSVPIPASQRPPLSGRDRRYIIAHLLFLVILTVVVLADTYAGVTSLGPVGLLSLVLLPMVAVLALVWRGELRSQRAKRTP